MNKRQKGRAFVKKVLEEAKKIDSGAYEVVGSGAGLDKGDLRMPRFDLVGECKDHKAAQVAAWTEQSEKEGLGYSKTALFWRHPKSPSANPNIRVDISMDYFLELLSRYAEPKIKEPDRNMRYKIQRLIQSAKDVMKELEI